MSRAAARKPVVRLAREQRVDEILQAARDVFCEKGYEAAAVAEIAEPPICIAGRAGFWV